MQVVKEVLQTLSAAKFLGAMVIQIFRTADKAT